MKKVFSLIWPILIFSCQLNSIRKPNSELFSETNFILHSEIVNEDVTSWILMPKFNQSPMPVVYFLHGRDDSPLMFSRVGLAAYEEHLKNGGRPFAVVAFQGKNKDRNFYWVDEARGLPWATMLITEVLPQIETKFNIGKDVKKRMIAGISMGSAGALQLSMNFPNIFKCAAGHSLVVRDAKSAVEQFPIAFGSEQEYEKRNPLSLLKKFKSQKIKPFEKVWIDIGGQDNPAFIKWAKEVAQELKQMGYSSDNFNKIDIAEDYKEGAHDDTYWKARMPEYLNWYARCFHSK